MGIGPHMINLYKHFKAKGLFDDICSVMELGSQDMYCKGSEEDVVGLIKMFDPETKPDSAELALLADSAARFFYEKLGFKYACIDTNGLYGALELDLNCDSAPDDQLSNWDMVTNHGTTEHLLNQRNAFKVVHDLTAPGGLMLHVLPFCGYVDHGFFNYQPNFFQALALHNRYYVEGVWFHPDQSQRHFIPYQSGIVDHVGRGGDGSLAVLLRKKVDAPFATPFQGIYLDTATAGIAKKYEPGASDLGEGFEFKPVAPSIDETTIRKNLMWSRKIAIFGASGAAKLILPTLKKSSGYQIVCLFDNDKRRHGEKLEGIDIVGPESIDKEKIDYIIVASAPGYLTIARQLGSMGYVEGRDFCDYRRLPELM